MKQFLVILGLTALVWLGVSMMEPTEYRVEADITYSGYDHARYAVAYADTTLVFNITTNGFSALAHSLKKTRRTITLAVSNTGSRHAIAARQACDAMQQSMAGVSSVATTCDSLYLILAERESRTYTPLLDKVQFSFAEQYGIYGQPTLTPAEITLYGSREVLDKIANIYCASTTISGIDHSGNYTLRIEDTWSQYGDVYPSADEVSVYIPVEAYVEREYQVPIEVIGADSTVQLRLYPNVATLHVWVAQRDIRHTPVFRVGIQYADILANNMTLAPQLLQFPDYVRPRSVEPREVQCAIIR